MSEPAQPSSSSAPAAGSPARPERRRNPHLRALVDEMLASIRVAANRELWTPEERASYEQDLAAIMTRVRAEATARRAQEGASGGSPTDPREAAREGARQAG